MTKADIFRKYINFCRKEYENEIDLTQGSENWYESLKQFNERPYEIINQLLNVIDANGTD